MDNQQVIESAYYAGLMDGEGCISLSRAMKKQGKYQLNPTINFTNTNQILLDFVCEFLSKAGITYHVQWYSRTVRSKPYACVSIHRRESMRAALTLLLPYLKGKRRQAELLLEFVNRRLDVSQIAQRNTDSWRYSERDVEISRQIQALNQKGREHFNDYTLGSPQGDDIVSSAAEMSS